MENKPSIFEIVCDNIAHRTTALTEKRRFPMLPMLWRRASEPSDSPVSSSSAKQTSTCDDQAIARHRRFPMLPMLWRRASEPSDSTVSSSSAKQISNCDDQAIARHYANVKMMWRSQQIANQKKQFKAQSCGWVVRRESDWVVPAGAVGAAGWSGEKVL